MLSKLAPYWKAAVGFVAPGAVILTSSVLDESAGGSAVTVSEWVTAGCACVITSAAVYRTTNRQV